MADHTIDTDNITTFADDTQNAVADLNTTITEIVDTYNGAMHATTGHSHSGATGDGPSLSSGIGTLSIEDYAHALILGGYQ